MLRVLIRTPNFDYGFICSLNLSDLRRYKQKKFFNFSFFLMKEGEEGRWFIVPKLITSRSLWQEKCSLAGKTKVARWVDMWYGEVVISHVFLSKYEGRNSNFR